jgi:hypothetical protein
MQVCRSARVSLQVRQSGNPLDVEIYVRFFQSSSLKEERRQKREDRREKNIEEKRSVRIKNYSERC